jgi:hypothetical protein
VLAHPRLGALVAGWAKRNLGGVQFALARFPGLR